MDSMFFPENPMDFINLFKFRDKEELYTNGLYLVPVFRVEQMLEHYFNVETEKEKDNA